MQDNTSHATDPGVVGPRIAERLGSMSGRAYSVADIRVLPAGASRTTYALTITDDESGESTAVIVRAAPAASPGEGGLAAEGQVLRAAFAAGVPVPEVLDLSDTADDPGVLGFPYAVMSFVDGESIPRRILRDEAYAPARAGFARQAGAILARIHAMDSAATGLTAVGDPLEALRTQMTREYDHAPAGLVLAIDWLSRNRPETSGETVVHGDFRLGNLLIQPDGVAAVLDWELAHLGDPIEDLGWLCAKAWRFGVAEPVAGMGSRADLLDGYAEVAGRRPTEATLHWWELYATVKWGLICGKQAARYLDGTERSMELAAIGRRSAEQEFDVLLALGLASPLSVPDPLAEEQDDLTSEDPHLAPTALDLLESVTAYLTDEVATDPGVSGHVRFHTRVANNVLATVRRQLVLGERQAAASRKRLSDIGVSGSAELADALRDGTLSATDPAVQAVVTAEVIDRLTVANPRHLSQPDC
ncbi:phosphotransferase family protein [Gordonia sp. CPCC 205515]|uniref:phosphotransferase family protein n=1 Tax=Gordonia sp. CPCC 205515 TaxID=3140791 RepID=UPI003AF33B94